MKIDNFRIAYIENNERKYFKADDKTNIYSTDTLSVKVDKTPYLCGEIYTLKLSGIKPNSLQKVYPFVCTAKECIGAKQYIKEGFTSAVRPVKDGMTFTTKCFIAFYENGAGLFARTVYPLKFNERTRIAVNDQTGELEIECDIPETFATDNLEIKVFVSFGDMNEALNAYATLLPDFHHTRTVVGYNTWDYYFTDIDEESIAENLAFIKNTPYLRGNLEYFTVDDGWQTGWGEWYANRRFPNGTKGLADLISSYGLKPGIWTAPLCVNTTCSFAPRKMKGFVKDKYGDPICVNGQFIIDTTHPDGRQYIRDLFKRLYDDGFRLFKVDYVSNMLNVQRFYDTDAAPHDAIRTLFEDIRASVGDSIIIGCSAPVSSCAKEIDCGRTGIDIHTKWGHITWAVENSQYYYNLHNRIWVNDPDFMVVRGDDTDIGDEIRNPRSQGEHNPHPGRWRGGRDFSLNEARTWAAYVMALGGCMNLSDRLALLNEKGLEIIRKALQYRKTETAIPLNQFGDDLASVWKQGKRYYLFNFTDEEKEFSIKADYDVFDLWTEKEFTPVNGEIRLKLNKHSSAVLEAK